MKPYYQDNLVTIYHGDCREVMPNLARVGLVLTDPPFGVSKRSRTYAVASGPVASWDGVLNIDWLPTAARLAPCLAVMPGVVNLPRYPISVGCLVYRWTLAVHVANGMTRGPFGYGNWIPCMVWAEPDVRLYRQKGDVGRVAISGTRPDHPAPKPLAAMGWLCSVLPDGTVLDPFMGSGTTLLASREAGRHAIGIEIAERYCEIAANRCRQEVLGLTA